MTITYDDEHTISVKMMTQRDNEEVRQQTRLDRTLYERERAKLVERGLMKPKAAEE